MDYVIVGLLGYVFGLIIEGYIHKRSNPNDS